MLTWSDCTRIPELCWRTTILPSTRFYFARPAHALPQYGRGGEDAVYRLRRQNLGTIFVQRSDPNSRKQARAEVAKALQADPQPPVVIFPEGRLGPGTKMLPFRNGAFIASENGISLLPCAVRYRPLEVAWWRGQGGA